MPNPTQAALAASLKAGTLSPSQALALLEEGLAAGRIDPAEFRALEAVVEEVEAAR